MFKLNPYLNFADNCEQAFSFYKSVFGGEFAMISYFKDMPGGEQMPESELNKVMHVSLPIGDGFILMGSDTPAEMGEVKAGNNLSISLHPTSEAEGRRLFDGLSAGGKIIMPYEKTFWNAYYGMFVDKFGIQWMVNYDLEHAA